MSDTEESARIQAVLKSLELELQWYADEAFAAAAAVDRAARGPEGTVKFGEQVRALTYQHAARRVSERARHLRSLS